MSSPANTNISFLSSPLTLLRMTIGEQISFQWEEKKTTLSFVNMNIKIKITKDKITDVMLQSNYSMLILPEMYFHRILEAGS